MLGQHVPLRFLNYSGKCCIQVCTSLSLFNHLNFQESPWTPIQRLSAVFIVGTVFCQLFVICRLGDSINITVNNALDNWVSNWCIFTFL